MTDWTKEDIYKMVRESDLGFLLGDNWMMHDEFEYFAALIASAEREACAKLCDERAQKKDLSNHRRCDADLLARSIRERGQE